MLEQVFRALIALSLRFPDTSYAVSDTDVSFRSSPGWPQERQLTVEIRSGGRRYAQRFNYTRRDIDETYLVHSFARCIAQVIAQIEKDRDAAYTAQGCTPTRDVEE